MIATEVLTKVSGGSNGADGSEEAEGGPTIRIGVIVGSTRPGRLGESVARWVYELARQRADASFEWVDLREYGLPHLDEPSPPSRGQYTQEHTRAWSRTIGALDGFVFVTPEYNHGTSGALKDAIDFLSAEWQNKAAGFVGYGASGGVRAVEELRLTMGALQVADVTAQASFSLFTDFENFQTFRPDPAKQTSVHAMLDQLVAWATALRELRVPSAPPIGEAPARPVRVPA